MRQPKRPNWKHVRAFKIVFKPPFFAHQKRAELKTRMLSYNLSKRAAHVKFNVGRTVKGNS
jgi:hypothetical protein